MKEKSLLSTIFMASGASTRFGKNKLLAPLEAFGGRRMIDVVLENHPAHRFFQTVVVTCYPYVAVSAAQRGFTVVECAAGGDISQTIAHGLTALSPVVQGCMFSVCDQPYMQPETIEALVDHWLANPTALVAPAWQGQRGNPVIFPKDLFSQLQALRGEQSGSRVIAQNEQRLLLVERPVQKEFLDIDKASQL